MKGLILHSIKGMIYTRSYYIHLSQVNCVLQHRINDATSRAYSISQRNYILRPYNDITSRTYSVSRWNSVSRQCNDVTSRTYSVSRWNSVSRQRNDVTSRTCHVSRRNSVTRPGNNVASWTFYVSQRNYVSRPENNIALRKFYDSQRKYVPQPYYILRTYHVSQHNCLSQSHDKFTSRAYNVSQWLISKRHYHVSKHHVEVPNCSVTDYVFREVWKYGKHTALIDGTTGRSVTFETLKDQVDNVTGNLLARGVQKSHVVCLCGTNATEFAHVFCGVAATGAALTIANAQLTAAELTQQVVDTDSRILIVTKDCAEKAKEVNANCPLVEIFVLGKHDGCTPFDELLTPLTSSPDIPTINPVTDVALVPFSSGTTGLPKGVLLTHRNLVAELAALGHRLFLPFSRDERSLSVLPMVHIAGMVIGMLNPLCQGATVVVLPRFQPETFLEAVQIYRIKFCLIAPPVVNFLATDPMVASYDLTSFTTPYSGAAPLSRELTERMVCRLGLTGIRQGYGMSEASPATHTTPSDGWKYGSIGIPLPNTESKIVDIESGEVLPANENGEIWVRGPQVMKGYLNNPEATAHTINHDGWLKTGDIGYYDEDGHYFVVDRLKEIIKYKGYQIAPAYLESLLLSHDAVEDAAVVGVPHPVHGHIPRAYVVCNSPAHEAQLAQFVNDQVAPYKRLRGGVKIVTSIPRSTSGKILRRKIAQ